MEARKIGSVARVIFAWLLTLLEALSMVDAGWGKFEHAAGWRHWFETWGYGAWLAPVVGVAEMALGLLMLVPRLAAYAAAGLLGIMAVAFYTVTTKPTDLSAVDPVIHGALLAIIIALRWRQRFGARPDDGATAG